MQRPELMGEAKRVLAAQAQSLASSNGDAAIDALSVGERDEGPAGRPKPVRSALKCRSDLIKHVDSPTTRAYASSCASKS
jgi:hypothetical protein